MSDNLQLCSKCGKYCPRVLNMCPTCCGTADKRIEVKTADLPRRKPFIVDYREHRE